MQRPTWRKSSYSGGGGGACVEVAALPARTRAIRDSKNPTGPVLIVTPSEWTAFATSLRDGHFG